MTSRAEVIESQRLTAVDVARAMVGVPFFHLGRTTGGMDCAGLLAMVRSACGLEPARVSPYEFGIHGERMGALLSEFMAQIPRGEARVGDSLWFRTRERNPPSHLLLLVEERRVVHAHWRRGVVEHVLPMAWEPRIVCAWRFLEWVEP